MSTRVVDIVSLVSSRGNRLARDNQPEEGEIPCYSDPSSFLKGLREVAMESLPQDEQMCSICQEPYGEGKNPEKVLILSCKHTFGSSCIQQWLSGSKRTCPLCREVLFYTNEEPAVGHLAVNIDEDEESNSDLAAGEEYTLADDVDRPLRAGTDDGLVEALRVVKYLVRHFRILLLDNRSSLNSDSRPYILASVQLLRLFQELTKRSSHVSRTSLNRLGTVIVQLAQELREPLQRLGEPVRELRSLIRWSEEGLTSGLLDNPDHQADAELAIEHMIDAEENWVLAGLVLARHRQRRW